MFLIVIQVYVNLKGEGIYTDHFNPCNDYSSMRFSYHGCTNLTVITISDGRVFQEHCNRPTSIGKEISLAMWEV